MAKFICGMRVVLLFFFISLAACEPPSCTFPKDFSHRNKSAESWLQSREKRQVLDDWDRTQWSTIHKRLDARANLSAWDTHKSEANLEEVCHHWDAVINVYEAELYNHTMLPDVALSSLQFMKWSLGNKPSSALPSRFTVAYMERPWWRADGSQALNSFATEDLKQGDLILDLPVRFCLSDVWTTDDPKSLYSDGAPWEVRLAAKILRERSKGMQSRWTSYIKLLPNFLPLPIFFSELEVNNIQDKTVQDEVDLMRNFAKLTFQSLRADEIAGAKFGDYVWALSVVYTSVCQVVEVKKGKLAPVSSHYLVPFFYANPGDKRPVYAKYEEENLKLSVYDVKKGMPLTPDYASTTLRDTFLFRGFVPNIGQEEKIKVFSDVLDLVDWYSSLYGGVNHNRYLTYKLTQDAMDALTAHLQESDASDGGLTIRGADFSVGASGYVDNYMIAIFATLYYANHVLSGETLTTIDFIVKNGTTEWEGILKAIALESVSRYRWNTLDCKPSQNSLFQPAFSSAKLLIRERLATVLDSFSTDLEEDKGLLAAAAWEGMNELEQDQLACPPCRWQTEQMSYHDNLAVQFRASLKTFILHMISELACGASKNNSVANIDLESYTSRESAGSLQKFLNWCEGHNLIISDRLAITEIAYPTDGQTYGSGKYRGVVALEDIHKGQTLCTLPMSVGLFNNDSGSTTDIDTWDLAAARLLREKAKGLDSNYAPYISILPEYLPTPIHLESQEVMEVQWLPMVRELVQVRKAVKESFARLDRDKVAWADFPEYKWAVTMVHSRAFTLPVRHGDKYEQYVLMPFMDMINHHYRYQADWMSQDIWDGKLEIVARRNVKKGEELFASFGPRSNDNLFLYYGFVLEGNPFDSAPIFGSFEEALKWFLNLWTENCTQSLNPAADSLCQQRNWQLHWYRMKEAMEGIESGSSAASGREWADLLGYWADLGYQFLPYQPGPTIYPNGVIDPTLLTAFSSFYEVIDNVTKENGGSSPWPDPCPECGNNSAVGSSAMRKFFRCVEDHAAPLRGLRDGHLCQSSLAEVLLGEQKLKRGMLLARISVALRCSEILASFSTTVDEDRELLNSTMSTDGCRIGSSVPCRTSQTPSRHLQLTWRYRYMKKLLLQAPIEKVLN